MKYVVFFLLGVISSVVLSSSAPAKSSSNYFCFGAVGKQCAIPGSVKGIPSPLNMVACSNVEKGKTNCWVSPGSIEHDNCCSLYPNGAMCSSETENDGHCTKVWAEAYQDINRKLAWYHIFNIKERANLTFVQSKRMKKYGGMEAQSTLNLCAPGGTKLLAHYDPGFCCSGSAKKQGEIMICSQGSVAQKPAPKKGNQLTKKSQQFLNKAEKAFAELEKILRDAKVPAKKMPISPQTAKSQLSKAQQKFANQPVEKKWPELSPQQMAQAQKLEQQIKAWQQQASNVTPPSQQPIATQQPPFAPPPQLPSLPEQYRKVAPTQQRIVEQPKSQPLASRPRQEYRWTPPAPSQQQREPEYKSEPQYKPEPQYQTEQPRAEEGAMRTPQPPQQVEEVPSQHCASGTWSSTFHTCIEEHPAQQQATPQCGGGAHWSPTLQSCQPN